jgi:hypothetical protein
MALRINCTGGYFWKAVSPFLREAGELLCDTRTQHPRAGSAIVVRPLQNESTESMITAGGDVREE